MVKVLTVLEPEQKPFLNFRHLGKVSIFFSQNFLYNLTSHAEIKNRKIKSTALLVRRIWTAYTTPIKYDILKKIGQHWTIIQKLIIKNL